jgi:prepilin-type processing-associated H-X9-DG protein/prepilin-type N-terminal cleavage/methylation domain-containing protein
MLRRTAFTLVELLVVIGIITLLMAILLPALSGAQQNSKTLNCLSNLRQMAIAAQSYANTNGGSFPIAYYNASDSTQQISYNWDFTTTKNLSTGQLTVEPGLLWGGDTNAKVQQCPMFFGRSNTLADPYTGYNYNTSYIGHGQFEDIVAPAKVSQVRQSPRCAIFGDGQYTSGADKFMRSPFPSSGDASFTSRAAGTQGFRHRGKTNVAFCDGHAETLSQCFTNTIAAQIPLIAVGTGFLSVDNSLYTLDATAGP